MRQHVWAEMQDAPPKGQNSGDHSWWAGLLRHLTGKNHGAKRLPPPPSCSRPSTQGLAMPGEEPPAPSGRDRGASRGQAPSGTPGGRTSSACPHDAPWGPLCNCLLSSSNGKKRLIFHYHLASLFSRVGDPSGWFGGAVAPGMKWCLINAQLSPGVWVRGTILLLAWDVLLSPRLVAASSTTEIVKMNPRI